VTAAKEDLPKQFDDIEQISDRHKDNPVAQEKSPKLTRTSMNSTAPCHVDRYVDLERKSDDPARLESPRRRSGFC